MKNKPQQIRLGDRFLFVVAITLYATPLRGWSFHLLSFLKARRSMIPNVDLLRARIRIRQGSRNEAVQMLKEELRLFPANRSAARLLDEIHPAEPTATLDGLDGEISEMLSLIAPFTMLSMERQLALLEGARKVCLENLEGNFVECGVAAGGSSAMLAWAVRKYSSKPRLVYCFDTFEGMPAPGQEDKHAGTAAQATGWGEGTCAAPLDSLMSLAAKLGVTEYIRPVKGFFQNTLPATKDRIGPIALMHLDGDWYDSTRAILENLYPQAVAGAYLQVDDYGYWDGCRKAIEEFEAGLGAHFDRQVIDSTGIWFRKPDR